jgi:hypothetical protein
MAWWKPWTWGDESESAVDKRDAQNAQGNAASGFADTGQANYDVMTNEARGAREQLRDIASGKVSLSKEQLRQGLNRNAGAMQSMASSAAPGDTGAARMAMLQTARLGSALSGQQAMAGIAEREAATRALNEAITSARGQDMQVALGSRQNATNAYGGVKPEGSFIDKWGNAIVGGMGAMMKSDRRAKTDIVEDEDDAQRAVEKLRSYRYRYKDKRDGEGEQLGVMAQELEKGPLKHAVIDTPGGKVVHGAKLAGANTALIAGLARRVRDLEGKGGK